MPRDRDRKALSKKRGRTRVVVYLFELLLFAAVIGGGGYAFYGYLHDSPEFLVKTIKVEGANRLGGDAVVAASGITRADNLFFFNARAACERVETLPLVKTCVISRAFPDQVEIEVVERETAATLLAGNQIFEIDGECVVIERVDAEDPIQEPLITNVPDLGVVELGQQLDSAPLREALKLWEVFSATETARQVTLSEIAAHSTKDLRMIVDDLPYELRWGRGNYAEQAKRLDVFWKEVGPKAECKEYLDLRFEPDIICK